MFNQQRKIFFCSNFFTIEIILKLKVIEMTNIELFAGAGGLALGIEQAGFECIGLIDFNHDACETLKKNRPNWNVIEGDITKIAEEDLEKKFNLKKGELDFLSGGYPCQSFSYAGKRLGLEDVRGTMFYYYSIFLKKLKPKMFLAENVKGLLNHDGGKTLQTMIDVFEEIGYKVQYKVLNAWDYGVAQKRERIAIVGIRNDLVNKVKFEFPIPHEYKPVLRDVLKNVPPSDGEKYSDKKKAVMDLVPAGGCWINLPDKVARDYMKSCYFMGGGRRGIARRMSMDEPCLTLTCAPAMKQTERCHPIETRPFTIREYARIQSFPDEWEFVGKRGSQYTQIGNAVPVLLAYEIAKEIKNTLEDL